MLIFTSMAPETQEDSDRELTPFTAALYAFLRANIDNIDLDRISGSDFSTLLDLKKAVDAVVANGIDRFRSGRMS